MTLIMLIHAKWICRCAKESSKQKKCFSIRRIYILIFWTIVTARCNPFTRWCEAEERLILRTLSPIGFPKAKDGMLIYLFMKLYIEWLYCRNRAILRYIYILRTCVLYYWKASSFTFKQVESRVSPADFDTASNIWIFHDPEGLATRINTLGWPLKLGNSLVLVRPSDLQE